jgi:hypothetical protein
VSQTPVAPATSVVLLGQMNGSRVEASSLDLGLGLTFSQSGSTASAEPFVRASVTSGHVHLSLAGGDGLLSSLAQGRDLDVSFEAALSYSPSGGLKFELGGGLQIDIPLHLTLGPISVSTLHLALASATGGGIPVDVSADIGAAFGPFSLSVQGLGLRALFTFPDGGGNLGPLQLDIGFKTPNGIGVAIDGGGISGGGFLSHDETTGRYAGALELKVFIVNVKAFGILDTRFPDGSEGVSFVVVIVAEFTPIQLGFGFTLVGVGGMLGVNRTMDEQGLADAVRTGSLENLLFPRNPVQDAPAIINDLATVFPAARDHQLFGPMAKFGWGTPTLISADLGIVLEFPGPRIALLGVVRMQLPSPEFALVSLQMAIAGLFDFPAGKFEINASLFDSYVAGYLVSGDMAYRLEVGNSSQFLLSIGGYNPGFRAPVGFPQLRRAAVELGLNGNPSLTASGYFALTSNTAQFGAGAELRAHGFGINLRGHIGFDVMLTFSPLHFSASISAGVHVDFHGFGFGITLHGSLSGPSPWHLNGRVCVEVVIWDACLPIDLTFGNDTPAALPELDPWFGTPFEQRNDPRIDVIGLGEAVADPRNWAGEPPAEGLSVVSLAAAATTERTPIDPMGALSLRQKVCPLKQVLERFGEYAPRDHKRFEISSVVLNASVILENTPEKQEYVDRSEQFAPAHFMSLSNAERLSMPSYDDMVAGVSIAPDRVAGGPIGGATLEYETVFIKGTGERVAEEPGEPRFTLTDAQLQGLLPGSATARGGIRRAGARKYQKLGRKLVLLKPPTFVVADACSLEHATAITPQPVSRTQALLALRAHRAANPGSTQRFTLKALLPAA